MIVPTSSTPFGAGREREHGQILVLFAFVLMALLLISALAVDYGGWLLARRSYQNVADEAALAGSYLLTSPTGGWCDVAQTKTKQQCARTAAWQSIQDHIGNLPDTPANLGATRDASIGGVGGPGVSWNGWTVWVASEPNDANFYCPTQGGTKTKCVYTGFASSNKTIFVRVDRKLDAGLSRIAIGGPTVGAWATAGRIPENFAILVLCSTGCLAGGSDVQTAGSNSSVVLESGDLGSNSFAHTGNNSNIALCTGDANTSQCSAYMAQPSQCQLGDSNCQLVAWNGTSIDPSTNYSALAIPQVVDPQYQPPALNSTTTPYQCYSTLSSAPGISAIPAADQFAQGYPFDLAAAQLPPTPAPVTVGAGSKVQGTVTAVVGGAALNNIKVTLTPGGYNATTGATGAYSINSVPNGVYTLTATDPTPTNPVYHTYTSSVTVAGANVTKNFAMNKNPSFSGEVYDSSVGLAGGGITAATVSMVNGANTYTTTTVAGGTYTLYVDIASATYAATGTATNYASTSYSVSSGAVDTATSPNNNFGLNPNPGTIQGTVTSGGSPVVGATVTITNGGVVATNGSGFYTLGVSAGSHTITVTASGYSNGGPTTVTVGAGATVTQNFTLIGNNATITGTVQDQTTGLPLAGVVVTAANTANSGTSAATGSNGVYTISGLQPSTSADKYTVTPVLAGYTFTPLTKQVVNAGSNTIDFTATLGRGGWPINCGTKDPNGSGKSGNYWGNFECATANGCTASPTNSGNANVSCSAFDATNRIRPGTYYDITIDSGTCAWIDPVGGGPGLTSGQKGGIVYVTNHLDIQSTNSNPAFLFGDGVTIVLGPNAYVDVGNSGGFVLNYKETNSADTFYNTWRTMNYIGGGTGASQVFSTCGTDTDGASNLSKGGITTGGNAHVVRYDWDTSGATPCYEDGDSGANATTYKGEIGIAWYLKGSPGNSHRFAMSSQMGFLFDGVLYGPKDDIQLGGTSGQAAAGQIVAWTLKYNGSTEIHQKYAGIEVDGSPYLIEPYAGE